MPALAASRASMFQKSEILWVGFRPSHRIPVLVSDMKGNLPCAMADGKGMRIASKKCG